VRARPGNENDRAALEDVTALFYNEERNEIYTGNNDGRSEIVFGCYLLAGLAR